MEGVILGWFVLVSTGSVLALAVVGAYAVNNSIFDVGVMAVFGLYQVKEDDPHRAISAALAMAAGLDELNVDLEASHGVRLSMRVGIDTLSKDLVMAGAGSYSGSQAGSLNNFFAAIMPYRQSGNCAIDDGAVPFTCQGPDNGLTIEGGETIGYVGSTGNASENAPHLHFAIFRLTHERQWWKGDPVNPYSVFRQ